MTSWGIAWQLRRTVLPASVLPFLYMLAIDFAEPRLLDAIRDPDIGHHLTDTLFFAGDALFFAMLLDAYFSRGFVQTGLVALLPSRNALRFAVLTLPLGLAVSLLHSRIRSGMPGLLQRLLEDDMLARPGPLIRFATDLVIAPGFQTCLAALVFAPIAVRVLELPVLLRPVRTFPGLGLVVMLLLALAISYLLMVGATRMLAALPTVGATAVPDYVGWYVGAFTLLTLAAAAVAAMLQRRIRS